MIPRHRWDLGLLIYTNKQKAGCMFDVYCEFAKSHSGIHSWCTKDQRTQLLITIGQNNRIETRVVCGGRCTPIPLRAKSTKPNFSTVARTPWDAKDCLLNNKEYFLLFLITTMRTANFTEADCTNTEIILLVSLVLFINNTN